MGIEISLLNVRRSILIQATPERVWREFQSFDSIGAWFGRGHQLHTFEPRLNGHVEMSVEIDGKRRHFGGPIIVYAKALEMSIETTWKEPWEATYASATPNYWTFRLTPLYGGTLVELYHHGFELTGADAADNLEGYEEGWDVKHLKALRGIIEK